MNYSNKFLGWTGEIAKDFTYSDVQKLSMSLAEYFKKHSSPGQKVIIGFDSRYLAKEFAEFIASNLAKKGIKAFFGNRVASSSVLIHTSLQKKAMGTIVVTGDEMNSKHLGIRCYNAQGHPLEPSELDNNIGPTIPSLDSDIIKWIKKGYVEPFDPTICFENHVEEQINFTDSTPFAKRILFNPLHGSGTLYFDRILTRKNIHGYTIDSELIGNLNDIVPSPFSHRERLISDMDSLSVEVGFMVSPDCTTFEAYNNSKFLSTEDILILLCRRLLIKHQQLHIVLSPQIDIDTTCLKNLNVSLELIEHENFSNHLKNNNYHIAIDSSERFYFEKHGAPDALMVGYYLIDSLRVDQDKSILVTNESSNTTEGINKGGKA